MFGFAKSQQKSVVDCIKDFDMHGIMEHIKNLHFDLIEMTTFFAAGVLAGFLCKRYLKTALLWMFVAAVLVVIFDYIGLVAIQWDFIHSIVGNSPAQTCNQLFESLVIWARANVPVVVSLIAGFIAGIKVG